MALIITTVRPHVRWMEKADTAKLAQWNVRDGKRIILFSANVGQLNEIYIPGLYADPSSLDI